MAEWQFSAGLPLVSYFRAEAPKWEGGVAAGSISLPRYEGARGNRWVPIVAGELRYRDLAYVSSSEGIGFNALRGKTYRVGATLGYDVGRKSRRDTQLAGLENIDLAPQLKLYAEKVLFPFVLRSTLLRTLAPDAGVSADVSFYLPVAGNKQFFVLAGPSLMWADATEMRRRFGVSAAQSANSGLAAYRPGAGFRHASLGVSATWFIDDHWFVNATGSAQLLLGEAANSPVVEDDRQQALILLGGYRW